MNRVVALICTAGLLGVAYYVYPLRAQDDKFREAPDDSVPPPKKQTFRETPEDRDERDQGPNRPKEAKTVRPSFGRILDDDSDHRPRASMPVYPGGGAIGMGRQHDRDVMFRRRVITRHVQEEIAEPVPPEEQEEHKQFRGAIQQLKDAKDDTNKKDEVAKTLRELLNKQFERDLAHRENELAAVEERVKTLRKQLDKRKSAKDDIITLRVKTIINDVDGLGFPGEEGFKDDPNVRGLPSPAHFEFRTHESEATDGGDSKFWPRRAPGKMSVPAKR